MNQRPWWKDFLNIWVIGGGMLIAILLLAIFWGGLIFLRGSPASGAVPTAALTVIAAPTQTQVVVVPTLAPSPTATFGAPLPPANGEITVGIYVQISGTGGDGLRLRSDPGTQSSPRFLGGESEVFQVKDGPREADGITWWFLAAPYDENRSGWAASNYLSVIQSP